MAMGGTETGEGGPRPMLELVPSGLKPPSAQKRRLFELPAPDADEAILHAAFVDVGLPLGPKSTLVPYQLNAEARRTHTSQKGGLSFLSPLGR
jgi:hypothetical protein